MGLQLLEMENVLVPENVEVRELRLDTVVASRGDPRTGNNVVVVHKESTNNLDTKISIYGNYKNQARDEIINYIEDIEPLGERLIMLTLRGPLPIRIFCVYSPPADHDEANK